jgi:hypothetical protein
MGGRAETVQCKIQFNVPIGTRYCCSGVHNAHLLQDHCGGRGRHDVRLCDVSHEQQSMDGGVRLQDIPGFAALQLRTPLVLASNSGSTAHRVPADTADRDVALACRHLQLLQETVQLPFRLSCFLIFFPLYFHDIFSLLYPCLSSILPSSVISFLSIISIFISYHFPSSPLFLNSSMFSYSSLSCFLIIHFSPSFSRLLFLFSVLISLS